MVADDVTGALPKPRSPWRSMILPLVVGAALIAAAGKHRLELDSPEYAKSPWMVVEALLLVGLLLIGVLQPFRMIYFAVKAEWRRLGVAFLVLLLCLALMLCGIFLDAPTLLYGT